MKAYLLGELGELESAVIEEKYFSDPLIYRWVRESEDDLIKDYLDDRLPAPQRERFERRYLVVPELAKRVETLRSQSPQRGIHRMQIVFIGLALMAFVFAGWFVNRSRQARPPDIAHSMRPSIPAALLIVHLAPGVTKAADAKTVEFAIPAGGRVRLSLELPGRPSPVDCAVTLAILTSDGGRRKIWSGNSMSAPAANGSQEVVIEPDPSALRPGDYIAEVDSLQGETLEKYVFRVNP